MSALSRSLLVGALTFLVASCQEDGPADSDVASTRPDLLADQRNQCVRSGGTWGLRAGDSIFICFQPTRDANKTCSIASDCDGLCLARSRTCSPIKPFLGCHEILTEGGAQATQCVN